MADERTPAEGAPAAEPTASGADTELVAAESTTPDPATKPGEAVKPAEATSAPAAKAAKATKATGSSAATEQAPAKQAPAKKASASKATAKKAAAKKAPAKKAPAKKATKAAAAESTAATKPAKLAEPATATKATKATKSRAPRPPSEPVIDQPASSPERLSATSQPPLTSPEKPVPSSPSVPSPALIPGQRSAREPRLGPAAPGAWAAAAWDALQHADQPPQRLAELAVAEIGPRAAAWAGWLRDTYPDAPAHGIARLATAQAARGGLLLALSEVGGPAAAPIRMPAVAWIRVTVILRVAAAYGHDPTDEQRATDLIELLGLAPTDAGESLSLAGLGGAGGLSGAAGGLGELGLTRFAVSRLGLRRTQAAALLRVLFAASDHSDNLTRLAHRAIRHYRPSRQLA